MRSSDQLITGPVVAGPPLPRTNAMDSYGDSYLKWLGYALLGYALLGRGFAYLGFPPVFVGEILLLWGICVVTIGRSWSVFIHLTPFRILSVLMIWTLARTLPYLPRYGIDALRDAAMVGYGLFALIVGALLLQRPARLYSLLMAYRRFIFIFLGLAWFLFIVGSVYENSGIIPVLPGTNVPVISTKGGDVMVHLAGATAFLLVGMAYPKSYLFVMIMVVFFLAGLLNRGGMVSFSAAMLVLVLLRANTVPLTRFFVFGCLMIVVFAAVNPSLTVRERTISVEQLVLNVKSIFGDAGTDALDGSKRWRKWWWADIIDYTVRGPYFLTGKGFGINLADADGYSIDASGTLRSPHNGHLNMLARAGVPGLLLWIALQASWFTALWRSYFAAARTSHRLWMSIFGFFMAYWAAFMANITFDVVLEGPMGGIWFWSLFGAGVAATHIFRTQPDAVE